MAVIKTQFTLRLSPIDHAKIKKIAEIEIRKEEFEKTPKRSIKRYLYT